VRQKLEAILHPLIRAEALRQLLAVTSVYAMLVVPLLVENFAAYRPLLQRILLVDCDESQQIERTAARPGLDVTQARAIVAAQVSQYSRRALADDLIDNRGDFVHLDDQVARLHAEYLKLAARISSSS
jgi:dephospho-CoA kinase